MRAIKVVIILFLIVVLGILQSTNLLLIGGVKPNLLLVVLIVLAFFVEDAWLYAFFIAVAAILLKVRGFFSPEILVFILLGMTSAWVAARWHTQPIVNNVFLVSVFTVLFYALTTPSYLISNLGQLGIELIYNLVIAIVLFKTFELWLKTSSMLRT